MFVLVTKRDTSIKVRSEKSSTMGILNERVFLLGTEQ